MANIKKIFFVLVFLAVPIFVMGFNAGPVLAQASNSQTVQQEIESLLQQIMSLLQQLIQLKIKEQSNSQPQVVNNSGTAKLTVNATGVTAYVSINNGVQFAYVSPITLNNGDTYSVTASSSNGGNSTSKCSGTASPGGKYACNISISGS